MKNKNKESAIQSITASGKQYRSASSGSINKTNLLVVKKPNENARAAATNNSDSLKSDSLVNNEQTNRK